MVKLAIPSTDATDMPAPLTTVDAAAPLLGYTRTCLGVPSSVTFGPVLDDAVREYHPARVVE